jgi:UDP-glucose:(heptosyl)LPS alpha-1,3-glucosyltransferase
MKAAILIERAHIRLGGAERSVSELAAELNRQGVEATILAAAGDSNDPNTFILLPRQADQRTSLREIEKALQGHLTTARYDILHSTLPVAEADIYQPRGGSYREAMLRNAASYPSSGERFLKRSLHFFNLRRTELLCAEKRLLRSNPRVIVAALSEYVKRQFVDHYALDPDRIAVIPNAVRVPETMDFVAVEDFRNQIRLSSGLPESNIWTLYYFAANNFRLKGLRPLLLAFARACKIDPRPKLLVVTGADKRKEAWYRMARRLDIEPFVVFTGSLPDLYLPLAACDIAVLPTYYDPSSRFILEALAAGKPVITTRYNGAAEFIRLGVHGIVLDEPDDVSAMTDALLHLADVANLQAARQAIAADNLRERVSIARHAEEIISLYKTILARKNSTP